MQQNREYEESFNQETREYESFEDIKKRNKNIMYKDTFDMHITSQIEMCKNTLLVKSKEYATEDKLHNFRVAAQLRHCSMEEALAGFMSKHTVSIYDMCADQNPDYTIEQWNEKITDNIVYLLILKAIVEERKNKKES